jgi:hypothetical protein
MKMTDPHTGLQSIGIWALGIFLLISAAPLFAQQPSDAPTGESETGRRALEQPTRFTVTFDAFRVYEKAGRLRIDFDLEENTRALLDDLAIDLWIDAHVEPKRISPRGFTATEALSGTDGSVTFPDWLEIPKDRQVKLCLMGTTPADNLTLGRGYFCTNWSLWDVKKRKKSAETIVAFSIQYRPGAMPYPLSPYDEPRTPDF